MTERISDLFLWEERELSVVTLLHAERLHFLGYRLDGPSFSLKVTALPQEGITVVFLSPCCRAECRPRSKRFTVNGCGQCGRENFYHVADHWWEHGSTDLLEERLEKYLLAWGGRPLEAQLLALAFAERLLRAGKLSRACQASTGSINAALLGRELASPLL